MKSNKKTQIRKKTPPSATMKTIFHFITLKNSSVFKYIILCLLRKLKLLKFHRHKYALCSVFMKAEFSKK